MNLSKAIVLFMGQAVLICAPTSLDATMMSEEDRQPVSFDTDVISVLTKTGCNSAACHGAASGRGGFRLSLFGGDPAFDYNSIVRELRGRRVNLATAELSLVLRKPMGELDHEGGVRFDESSQEYEVLSQWIAEGAHRVEAASIISLKVTPEVLESRSLPATKQLTVEAIFSDGSRRDVTSWASYDSDDPTSTSIDDNGQAQLKRRGRSHLIVKYLSQLAVIPVSVPYDVSADEPFRFVGGNWIDVPVANSLKQLGLPPSERAAPTTLLRRVSLSLTGQLPSQEMVDQFLSDPPETRYERLVDRLLHSDEFNSYWTYQLVKLLRLKSPINEPQVAVSLHSWIKSQISSDASWNEMVAEMLQAEGDTHSNGPAVIHRLSQNPRGQAEYVSEVFMGVRMRCANCHNHPLDRWTQDDYHGLAAVFARVGRGRNISTLNSGEVIHPATGAAAIAKIPANRFLDEGDSQRSEFANWIEEDNEHMLARAFVNRIWQSQFGRALVEPADDLRASNPATHPELLKQLTNYFVGHGYRLRPLLREIALSSTFRHGTANDANRIDDRFNSHYFESGLDSAVLLDAIVRVTGIQEEFDTAPNSKSAIDLMDPSTNSTTLDLLGRCPVDGECNDAPANDSVDLPQILHLINGDLLNRRIEHKDGTLNRMLEEGIPPMDIIAKIYVLGLSRYPERVEEEYWQRVIAQTKPEEVQAVLADFMWGLLNSREFRTNH